MCSMHSICTDNYIFLYFAKYGYFSLILGFGWRFGCLSRGMVDPECLKIMVDELYELYKDKGITKIDNSIFCRHTDMP